jgi:hypothetical protein
MLARVCMHRFAQTVDVQGEGCWGWPCAGSRRLVARVFHRKAGFWRKKIDVLEKNVYDTPGLSSVQRLADFS